jgi:tripartite-type tricarboxylate transporter receptor subunit TctC
MRRIALTALSDWRTKTTLAIVVCATLALATLLAAGQAPASTAESARAGLVNAANPANAAHVTFILPTTEGSSADRIGHVIAHALAGVLDTQVQVRRVPGLSGITGTNAIAASASDGNTLGLGLSTPMAGGKLLSRASTYSPLESFDWLAIVGTYGNAMIVRNDNAAGSLQDWLKSARESSKPLRYGTSGTASAAHFAGEFLRVEQHANIVHQAFGVTAQAYAALASGEIDVLFDGIPSAHAVADPRRFRVLAVTSAKRNPLMAGVPAFGEVWPNRQFDMWVGIIAPNHLPADKRSQLVAAIGVMLADKTLIADLRASGMTWLGLAGSNATDFVKDDILRKAKQIADLAIRPDASPAQGGVPSP